MDKAAYRELLFAKKQVPLPLITSCLRFVSLSFLKDVISTWRRSVSDMHINMHIRLPTKTTLFIVQLHLAVILNRFLVFETIRALICFQKLVI